MPDNTIGWGQGAANNNIEWGKGASNNTIDWGAIYANSPAGDTDLGLVTVDPVYQAGLDYLTINSKALFDFTNLDVDFYETGPSTVSDLSTNGNNLTTLSGFNPIFFPIFDSNQNIGAAFWAGHETAQKSGYSLGTNASAIIGSSFEVHASIRISDGGPAGRSNFCGVQNGTGASNSFFRIGVNTTGTIIADYQIPSVTAVSIQSDSAIFGSDYFQTSPKYIRLVFDFDSDSVKLYVDGIEVASTVTGSIEAINPANFNVTTYGIGVGGVQSSTTVFQNILQCGALVSKLAITPIISDENIANSVGVYLTKTYLG